MCGEIWWWVSRRVAPENFGPFCTICRVPARSAGKFWAFYPVSGEIPARSAGKFLGHMCGLCQVFPPGRGHRGRGATALGVGEVWLCPSCVKRRDASLGSKARPSARHCTPHPAPGCVAEPQSLASSSLLVAARESGAAPLQHSMHTARSSAVAACSARAHLPRSPRPSHPLARRTLRHTTLVTTSPVMSLLDCGAPHEHILPSTLVLCQCRFFSTHVM